MPKFMKGDILFIPKERRLSFEDDHICTFLRYIYSDGLKNEDRVEIFLHRIKKKITWGAEIFEESHAHFLEVVDSKS